jgi:hypothetical protein
MGKSWAFIEAQQKVMQGTEIALEASKLSKSAPTGRTNEDYLG